LGRVSKGGKKKKRGTVVEYKQMRRGLVPSESHRQKKRLTRAQACPLKIRETAINTGLKKKNGRKQGGWRNATEKKICREGCTTNKKKRSI